MVSQGILSDVETRVLSFRLFRRDVSVIDPCGVQTGVLLVSVVRIVRRHAVRERSYSVCIHERRYEKEIRKASKRKTTIDVARQREDGWLKSSFINIAELK